LATIVLNELDCSVPALLCSAPGYDASGRVDDLATQHNQLLSSVAIGSAEGFRQATDAINSAVRLGRYMTNFVLCVYIAYYMLFFFFFFIILRWVLLKNVHLAPQWLVQLEKKLHSLQPHTNFRLFLTMEINSAVPVNLLRAGRIFVFEPPPGVKANLLRTFNTVSIEYWYTYIAKYLI